MKTNTGLLLAAVGLLMGGLACSLVTNNIPNLPNIRPIVGSGVKASETRAVAGFNRVDLAGYGELIIVIGAEENLVLEGDDNLLPYIETEVKGGTLRIGIREGTNIDPRAELRYYLSVTSLEQLEVSGLGSVDVPELETDSFRVSISGSGDVNLAGLQAEELVAELSGLGNLTVAAGAVERLRVQVSGSGNVEAPDLTSREAEVEISGLGSARVHVTENLEAEISGSGTVRYSGNPQVSSRVTGLGSIEKVGE